MVDKFSWEKVNSETGWLSHVRNCKYESITINDYEIEQINKVSDFIRELVDELNKYKDLWHEETVLVERMQQDKDYMDSQLMAIQAIVNEIPYSDSCKNLLSKLIMKARGRV